MELVTLFILIKPLNTMRRSVISQHNLSVPDLGSFPASAGTPTYAVTWPHSNSYCASNSWCLLLLPRSKLVEAKLMPQHVVFNHALCFIDVKCWDYNHLHFLLYISVTTLTIRTVIQTRIRTSTVFACEENPIQIEWNTKINTSIHFTWKQNLFESCHPLV